MDMILFSAGEIFGDRLNWQQAEDVPSFRQSNLTSVIAERISGLMGLPGEARWRCK